MRSFLSCLLAAALLLIGAALLSGCDSACKELGSKVCDCQTSRSREERCRTAIDAAYENREPSDGEEDTCQSILDEGTCTCEAVEADNLAACGLSNDAASIWTD
ncbi:MAG TPA: hypothetical protein PK668_09030 [Myxococcota bacterium]|nr:hypothetical protein [Myxococcota bacterium]HRY92877.1 hypothetical protein [Myxococcota bacterium]HSA20755.1 hypothetical protein [Myxococcota bacterium]